jgi:GAF domain-containing protein
MADLRSLHESLSRVVFAGRERAEVFTEITVIARRALLGSDAASITLIRGERAFSAAYDGQLALDVDELQYQRGYGPCVDAARTAQVMLVPDMRTEQRWPGYTGDAAERGVGSSLSVPLPFQSGLIGALNNYATRPDAFDADDVESAQDIAGWVALTVANADFATGTREELRHMRIAMASRSTIDQAKGILMERHQIDQEQAFTMLTRASQAANTKLHDIAGELVRTTGPAAGTS